MKEILAKSDGTTLINHSKLVSKFALEIAKTSMLDCDKELENSVLIGALLHDIGKCTNFFQNKLKKNVDDNLVEEKLPSNKNFRHNEIGWAFLRRYLYLEEDILRRVLDVVYWHHGISNEFNKYYDTDIIKELTEEEILIMKSFVNNVLSDLNIKYKLEEGEYDPKKPPLYYLSEGYNELNNAKNLFVRTCVISADRLASQYCSLSDEELSILVSDYNKVVFDVNLSDYKYYETDRFKNQIDIVNKISKTTQINAPAGFGKTILGMIWGFKRNRRLIWVCPRNIVAESVYHSIIEELNNLNNTSVKVELFITGEVKKSNHQSNGFDSDIIITNIDNYLAPTVNNSFASRLYTIINSDVVFDEFHELISKDSALFACFINLMITRFKLTNSHTLLLSATPTNMCALWDTINNKTLVLPNKHEHYPAPHQKKYKLVLSEDDFVDVKTNNSLFVVNAIKTSQVLKRKLNCELLLHSEFEKEDKDNQLKALYDLYGKSSVRNRLKPNVIGTHVIQASLDVSFNNLFESVLSPQSTLQRIGRCDRWGDCNVDSVINICLMKNRNENGVRDILYSKNLSNVWFDFLKRFDNNYLTIDDFYVIYNAFERQNEETLRKDLIKNFVDSLNILTHVYPIKPFNKTSKGVVKAGGNKLRSNGNDIFVISQYYNNSTKFTEPFSVTIRKTYSEEFKENNKTEGKIKDTWLLLRNTNDDRYDFNDLINSKKYISLDRIRVMAKNYDTPYIRFDEVYHPDYGLISIETLNIIQ